MKNLKSILVLFFAAAFVMTSCGEKDFNDKSYKGPLLIEFAKAEAGQSAVYLVEQAGVTFRDTLVVQLIGAHQSESIDVSWEIDPATTAVPGVHYNLVSQSTVTIEAGSSFAYIVFDAIGDGFADPSDIRTLDINIVNVSGAGADISVNGASVTQTMQITCPSDLVGTYDYTSTATNGSPTFWNGAGTMDISLLSGGTYVLADFADGAFGAPQPLTFDDICTVITENGAGASGLVNIESGSVDPVTGVITMNFVLTCCGGNDGDTWTYVLTPQ